MILLFQFDLIQRSNCLYMPVWTNWPALYKLPVCSNFKLCPPLAISLIEPGPRYTSFWILIHINPIISIVTFLLTTFLQTVSQFVKTLLKSSSSALFQLSAFTAEYASSINTDTDTDTNINRDTGFYVVIIWDTKNYMEAVRCFVIFSEGYIWLRLMIIHVLKQILTCFLTLCLTLWLSEDEHCK